MTARTIFGLEQIRVMDGKGEIFGEYHDL